MQKPGEFYEAVLGCQDRQVPTPPPRRVARLRCGAGRARSAAARRVTMTKTHLLVYL
jgi:hypothetical protein